MCSGTCESQEYLTGRESWKVFPSPRCEAPQLPPSPDIVFVPTPSGLVPPRKLRTVALPRRSTCVQRPRPKTAESLRRTVTFDCLEKCICPRKRPFRRTAAFQASRGIILFCHFEIARSAAYSHTPHGGGVLRAGVGAAETGPSHKGAASNRRLRQRT